MNIYIGNISYWTTEDEIRAIFEAYGKVAKVKVIKDKDTGKSRGFGFVEMPMEAEAIDAKDNLNGYKIGKRALKVNKARPRRKRGRSNGFRRRNNRNNNDQQRRGRDGKHRDNDR